METSSKKLIWNKSSVNKEKLVCSQYKFKLKVATLPASPRWLHKRNENFTSNILPFTFIGEKFSVLNSWLYKLKET